MGLAGLLDDAACTPSAAMSGVPDRNVLPVQIAVRNPYGCPVVGTPRTDDDRRLALAQLLSVEIAAAAIRRDMHVSTWEKEVARPARSTVSNYRRGDWSEGEPRAPKLKILTEDIYPSDADAAAELYRKISEIMGWGSEAPETAPPIAKTREPDLRRRPKIRQLLAVFADPLVSERVKDRLERRVEFALLEELHLADDSGQSEVDEAL